MRDFCWYQSDGASVDLFWCLAVDLDVEGAFDDEQDLLRAWVHVPRRADAWRHLQKIDHGLLDRLILARQVIAAKLNIGNFSDPKPVGSTIADADRLLAGFLGKLPYDVKTSSLKGKAMAIDGNQLQAYNSGGLTQGCTP